MLIWTTDTRWYARGGLAIFLLQISLFVFALDPFNYGTWYQVEPTVLALWVLAAINGAWLAFGFGVGFLSLQRPLQPFLLCLMAWVGWQYMATIFAAQPLRSWLGHPAIGEGAGYYSALVLCYLLASLLWQNIRYRNIILLVAALGLAVFSWHYFNPGILRGEGGWNPGEWASHLAFMVAYLWIAFMAAAPSHKRALSAVAALAALFILILIARNKTAEVLCIPAMIGTGAVLWLRLATRPLWRNLAIAACLLPLAWIAFSQGPGWASHADGSMPTRALFNQVSLSTLIHEPQRLIAGNGWGRYEDDLFKYALVDGISAFRDGEPAANWGMVNGHAFHAHNEAMETLLSLGMVGLLLWLALPLIVLRTMPAALFWRCAPMLLAVTALQSFWFILPHTLAYQALAFAALTPAQKTGRAFPARWLSLGCIIIAAAMAWSACMQWQGMRYGEALSHAVTEAPAESYTTDMLAEDFARGGDRFRSAAEFYSHWVAKRTTTGEVTPRDVQWYWLLMQAAHRVAPLPGSGAYLASMDMRLLNLLYMNSSASPLDTLKAQAKSMFPEAAIMLADKAPLREDIAGPFLYNLMGFTGGNEAASADILSRILAVAPDHRAALWAMGQLLLAHPDHAADGRMMLQRAAAMGVVRVYPLTPQELQ